MQFPTIVCRHRKENIKKCSLRGLENREDFRFFTYPTDLLPSLEEYILLAMDGPPLTPADAGRGLFVIDATWRYASLMLKQLSSQTAHMLRRSIPREYCTAYPRQQNDCPDARYGLASIEAIYVARHLLGADTTGLLDLYYWKEQFLQQNFPGNNHS